MFFNLQLNIQMKYIIIICCCLLASCSFEKNQTIEEILKTIDHGIESYNHNLVLDSASELIEIQPGNELGYYYKGVAFRRLMYYNEAIEQFDKAIEINPEYCKAYEQRGIVKAELNILHSRKDTVSANGYRLISKKKINGKDRMVSARNDIKKALELGCKISKEELFFYDLDTESIQ